MRASSMVTKQKIDKGGEKMKHVILLCLPLLLLGNSGLTPATRLTRVSNPCYTDDLVYQ